MYLKKKYLFEVEVAFLALEKSLFENGLPEVRADSVRLQCKFPLFGSSSYFTRQLLLGAIFYLV